MQNYEAEYKKLNSAQRQAVDNIEGPLLVVAGPGTGKTQLLSMRVANILRQTDTDARSILCLTFTNKAATNMRERLVSLIGPDAHAIQVKTFHSFAADIMAEYPDHFWNGARLTTAPDAVQLNVVHDILSRLPLDNPLALRFSGQFTAINDVQNGLKLTKEAGLTPEKLRSLIQANLSYIDTVESTLIEILAPVLSIKKLNELVERVADLPKQPINDYITPLLSLNSVLLESLQFAVDQDVILGKTTNTGAWKRRWLQTVDSQKGMFDERRRNQWWLVLADVYEQYRNELSKRGYYDYSDMLVQVISQLEQIPELRAQVQERFLYVLIDEFQDTNAAQLRLAHLVAVHIDNTAPNLMAVGDDDQSIFKFNGAELNNMLSFQRSYPTASLVVLTDNYRSSQDVLNTAAGIIEQAYDRLVKREPHLNKSLVAAHPSFEASFIQHLIYPTKEHQYSMLAEEITRRRKANPSQTVAVLARSHSSLKSIASSLHNAKQAVRYEYQQNILEHEAVKQIILLASTVVAITNGDEQLTNATLGHLLRHPVWGITPMTLWELAKANFRQSMWLESLLNSKDKTIQNIGHWLVWLSKETSYQPLPVMLEYLIGIRPGEHMTSPIHNYFIQNRPITSQYLQTLSAIHKLHGLVLEFCTGSQPSLSDFCEFIALNLSNKKVINDSSWFISRLDAIELLSVHKAKGLEFDTVYIIDAVEKEWQPRKAGRKPPANLPLQPYGDDYDDYVRLMYVATTRAKRHVIVTSYATDANGETVLPTPLIHKMPISQLATISEENSVLALENSLSWPRLPSKDEHALLQDRLDSYQLSATHLLNFLDVTAGGPQTFLERNLLKLPDVKSPQMAFGTAVHKALETAQKLTNTQAFSLDSILTTYEEALKNEYLPRPEYDRYLVHGQQTIRHLFEIMAYQLTPGGMPEQRISNVVLGLATLSGSLDRVDKLNDVLVITDYKTGQPLSSFDTRNKSKQVKAWRQRTQLIFYTLLMRNSPWLKTSSTNITGQMVYVESESLSGLVREYKATDEELKQFAEIIQAVWKHIHELSFPDTQKYTQNITGVQDFIADLLSGQI